jgi:hypothetical protein
MPACIPPDLWEDYAQEQNLKTGRVMSLTQTLTLWQMLASMDAEGYDLGKVLKRAIGLGFRDFDRRPELLKQQPQAPHNANQPRGQRHETNQRPLSAFDRVRQSGIDYLRRHDEENIIDINAYRPEQPAHGQPVGEDDRDLWPPLDVAVRRL